jgi:CDP-diglyceride synthetase
VEMHIVLVIQFIGLLTLANGAPVIAKKLFGTRLNRPLDGGVLFIDGQPLFGPSKTFRGIVASVVTTAVLAPLLALDWQVGLVVAIMAMAGDLLSSFLKRRARLKPSSRATGLDQIPEFLLPALACRPMIGFTEIDIAAVVMIFMVGEMLLSRLLFKWHVRDQPF